MYLLLSVCPEHTRYSIVPLATRGGTGKEIMGAALGTSQRPRYL